MGESLPTVIIPNRVFLAGALHGFNAGRVFERRQIQPEKPAEIQPFIAVEAYAGHWFHVECRQCGYMFAFDNPNELPEDDLICPSCSNIIIKYNSFNSNEWHIGPIKL